MVDLAVFTRPRSGLAEKAELAPFTLSRIENRDSDDLRFTSVVAIAKALGLSIDEIASRAGLVDAESGAYDGRVLPDLAAYDALRRLNERAERLVKDTAEALKRVGRRH